MTVHVCRDLLIGTSVGYATGAYDTMWALSVFLQGVLGYAVSSTTGSLVPPTYEPLTVNYYSASLSPASMTVVSSSMISMTEPSCFISASAGRTLLRFSQHAVDLQQAAYPIGWPSGSNPWPTGNPFQGDWIALRSVLNPATNSGIFVVTDSTTWLNDNAVEIDYRTSTATVVETGSYLSASVWLPPPSSDIHTGSGRGISRSGLTYPTFAALQSNNDVTGYQGDASSTYPRMLLMSPSTLGWSVRLCLESTADVGFGGSVSQMPALTAIPGFGGASGDFATGSYGTSGSLHLHAPQWLDYPFASASSYAGYMPGLDKVTVSTKGSGGSTFVGYRFYAWGDDSTGTCIVMVRGQTSSGSHDAFVTFGQADEEVGEDVPSICRLFVLGQSRTNIGVTWACGNRSDHGVTGLSFSLDQRRGPVSCVVGSYSYAAVQLNDSSSIRYDVVAADCPFLSATELMGTELIAGTWDNLRSPGVEAHLPIEPRSMGRFPFARLGRSTGQSRWATADDALTWLHVTNGFYVPWGGVISL